MSKPRSTSSIEQRIKDVRMQKSRNYSHADGTCVCVDCLCGQCKCQVVQQPYDYPKLLLSNYKREFMWKYSSPPKPVQKIEYQSNFDQIFRSSTYQRNFQSFNLQKTENFKPSSQDWKNDSPIVEMTSYRTNFKQLPNNITLMLKPIEVDHSVNLPISQKTTYKNHFRACSSQLENDHYVREAHYKRHTNQTPNPYLKTSYQHFYNVVSQSQTNAILPQQNQPFMPALSGQQNRKSRYQSDYKKKQGLKCQARQFLEEYIIIHQD
ncbi:unnamed protein product [Paramecium sonneborni]|uniref:STOP protein n=1 Tax=Paramecium sonneborni TaxID=65129 RepID=A0A8S1R8H0_9CILI|nr:unnamed protein product [Paramecium sonneborni]